jgi:hypothetical protein
MSQPVKRPTVDETEEDLLKLQADFMKQKQGNIKKDVVDLRHGIESEPKPMNRKRKISKEV